MSDVRNRLIRCLRDPGDDGPWSDELLACARVNRVHLLLADRTRIGPLKADLRAGMVIETARERELRQVLSALAVAGVRPVLLKGAALSRTHYPRPELRPRTDTDVMIPAPARDATAAALTAIGYQRVTEADGALTTGQFHLHKYDASGLFHALDVHCRISNVRAFADVLSYAELVRDARPLASLGPHAWGPSPVHALMIACVHRVAHHGNTDSLLWLLDVSLLAHSLEPDEREYFSELAGARGVRTVCRDTLMLADAAFGRIDAGCLASLRTATAEPTAAFLLGPMRQIDILKEDLRASPRLWQRLQIVGEHLFPKASFMYGRYRTRRKFTLPFLYAHRIVTGMPKWFRR
jgi:putative nucleotidyltransferase-like protein